MMDLPKKHSLEPLDSTYFSYNLQNNGRSSKNLNLNYRADRHYYQGMYKNRVIDERNNFEIPALIYLLLKNSKLFEFSYSFRHFLVLTLFLYISCHLRKTVI